MSQAVLKGISDIRRYFFRNRTPTYFISATNFNLLGMDEWVRNFHFINYIDCFDGEHPHVFVPSERPHQEFTCIEDINNYLLEHKEVVDLIEGRGPGGKAVFLFFDEETEKLCQELGLEVCFPPAELRREVDDKISATRIADRAGVPSVPNVLSEVRDYEHLREVSAELGDDLVIQTAFGDSGHTTFFISDEEDWDRHSEEIANKGEVKIMKRIRCRGSALEACVTRHGTIVGPLMTELVGFPELTPYRGGWCGNEVFAGAFPPRVREQAREATVRFGEELRKMGYRGYFELDFLTDLDTDEVYLGEVNPRITGASAMTNLAAFAHADAPLFLFHLLEWSDMDFELDVEALNARWASADNIDSWSQLVIKHTADTVEQVTHAPRSGVWEMGEDGRIHFLRVQTHRRTVEEENRGFFLRITRAGDYRYKGADLGILITPGRLMTDDHKLNDRARAWIDGIQAQYETVNVDPEAQPEAAQLMEVGNFKIL
ncbi:MAG: biotin carboxylase [Gemmatimonadota bacterium]